MTKIVNLLLRKQDKLLSDIKKDRHKPINNNKQQEYSLSVDYIMKQQHSMVS